MSSNSNRVVMECDVNSKFLTTFQAIINTLNAINATENLVVASPSNLAKNWRLDCYAISQQAPCSMLDASNILQGLYTGSGEPYGRGKFIDEAIMKAQHPKRGGAT